MEMVANVRRPQTTQTRRPTPDNLSTIAAHGESHVEST